MANLKGKTSLWLHHKFIYLVILVLLVVPLYPKFPLLGVGGTFVSIRLEDLIIAVVVGFWLLVNITKLKSEVWQEPINRAIVLYWLAGLVSVICSIFVIKTAELNLGLLHWLRRVEYMSLFMVSYSFLKSKEQLSLVVKTLLVVSTVVAVYGIGQLLLNFPVISTNNSEFSKGLALSLGPGARINSTFAGHYDLAAFSLFPLLLVIGLLAIPNRSKFLTAGIGALSYWAMLLSASRVTFAAFFLTASLFLLSLKKKMWLLIWLVLAAISIWLSPQLLGRYKELIVNQFLSQVPVVSAQVDSEVPDALKPPAEPEDRSLNIRLNVEWPRAIRAFVKNPILGTGFSSVGLAVDNDYLRSLAETGILGTAALMLVFARIFKTFFSKSRLTGLPQVFVLSVMWGLVGLLINALFIDVLEASKVAILTWTLLGLAVKAKLSE